ncbi:MAG: hypothetical protein ACKVT1_13365 [Dehalococcoidia bacterium]
MVLVGGCVKCRGSLVVEDDGWFREYCCLQCGFRASLASRRRRARRAARPA